MNIDPAEVIRMRNALRQLPILLNQLHSTMDYSARELGELLQTYLELGYIDGFSDGDKSNANKPD